MLVFNLMILPHVYVLFSCVNSSKCRVTSLWSDRLLLISGFDGSTASMSVMRTMVTILIWVNVQLAATLVGGYWTYGFVLLVVQLALLLFRDNIHVKRLMADLAGVFGCVLVCCVSGPLSTY